jgi:dTDP-4-dehydrorhamnose reductase
MDIKYHKPELWGGIECTINRVADKFIDQLHLTGHYSRAGDIEQFAKLGIKKLRYPVLWEKHQPGETSEIDWSWTETQLNTIRENNIEPIIGLMHHGSGPAFTYLGDPNFPALFASYAAKVAGKFPWIKYYTPVNEPLTTARFSGLYGKWYPHEQSESSFVKMLLLQLKATVLAMQAIRVINPDAQLIQTEDLAKTHSTTLLQYQANFENERRWLTYDILCARVNAKHHFWNYFLALGIAEKELQFFIDNPCPPAIIGFNYYVTSERYLDEKIAKYPAHTHGGNTMHTYADTEAVRHNKAQGVGTLLQEAWQRYELPMAITECHIGCSREEQLRWFRETWDTCCALVKKNIDIRAVTAWSLLGACDWSSLLTLEKNDYECGVFDTRGEKLRPTVLAKQLTALSKNGSYEHPLLQQKGWWAGITNTGMNNKAMPLLIIGKNGSLGAAFMRICDQRSIPYIAVGRGELDITADEQIEKAIDACKPWAIINASGYVRVDDAEANSEECFLINSAGPALLAAACRRHGIRFMTFSSDLVFDGEQRTPYIETDTTKPLNVYGASKASGELLVQASLPQTLVIRTSAFFGPWDHYNFVYDITRRIKEERALYTPADIIISPTYLPDLVNASLDLFIDEEEGIWHLANDGVVTWTEWARQIAAANGGHAADFREMAASEMGWKAQRPLYSALGTGKGLVMPSTENALQRYFEERTV